MVAIRVTVSLGMIIILVPFTGIHTRIVAFEWFPAIPAWPLTRTLERLAEPWHHTGITWTPEETTQPLNKFLLLSIDVKVSLLIPRLTAVIKRQDFIHCIRTGGYAYTRIN